MAYNLGRMINILGAQQLATKLQLAWYQTHRKTRTLPEGSVLVGSAAQVFRNRLSNAGLFFLESLQRRIQLF